jgi:hypothetical protein
MIIREVEEVLETVNDRNRVRIRHSGSTGAKNVEAMGSGA